MNSTSQPPTLEQLKEEFLFLVAQKASYELLSAAVLRYQAAKSAAEADRDIMRTPDVK